MKCPKCHFQWISTTRSNEQNRYYWGVIVDMLSEELGYEPEEIHEILKLKFLKPMGKTNTVNLTTSEFKLYNERIKIWAAKEHQMVIPDPL